jgi:uncharacterized protein YidB (DUF937 family)
MGLLDDLGKEVMSKAMGGPAVGGGATEVNWVQLGLALLQKFGGLDGLMAKFQEKGFGSLIASWVGTGENQPVSAGQIMDILGKKNVQDVAAEAGTTAEAAAGGIADVLPGLVDKLTPDGQPVGGDVLQQGIQALLGGKLGDLGKLFG